MVATTLMLVLSNVYCTKQAVNLLAQLHNYLMTFLNVQLKMEVMAEGLFIPLGTNYLWSNVSYTTYNPIFKYPLKPPNDVPFLLAENRHGNRSS